MWADIVDTFQFLNGMNQQCIFYRSFFINITTFV